MEETKRVVGSTKWFDNKRGWGFVECEQSDNVFIHFRNIESADDYKTLNEGESVSFELLQTDKGLQAVHLQRLGKSI